MADEGIARGDRRPLSRPGPLGRVCGWGAARSEAEDLDLERLALKKRLLSDEAAARQFAQLLLDSEATEVDFFSVAGSDYVLTADGFYVRNDASETFESVDLDSEPLPEQRDELVPPCCMPPSPIEVEIEHRREQDRKDHEMRQRLPIVDPGTVHSRK